MPRGDGTGPAGDGSMTGRSAGYCAGYQTPGYANPGPGLNLGLGRGFGRGRGFRSFGRFPAYGRGFYRPVAVGYREPSKEEEHTYLKNVMTSLEEELKEVKKRLREIEEKK